MLESLNPVTRFLKFRHSVTESDETLKDVENGDLGVAVGVSVSVIISIMLLVLFGLLHMKYGMAENFIHFM